MNAKETKLAIIINRHIGVFPEKISEYECAAFTGRHNTEAAVKKAFFKELATFTEKNNTGHLSISCEDIATLVEDLLDRKNGEIDSYGEGVSGTFGNSTDVFVYYNEVKCIMALCHECEEVGPLFEVVAVPLPEVPLEMNLEAERETARIMQCNTVMQCNKCGYRTRGLMDTSDWSRCPGCGRRLTTREEA